MIKDGKFGVHETIALLTITISAKVFFSSPSVVVAKVGTAGWYMTLISAFVAFLATVLLIRLLSIYPNKTLMEIYEIVYGKVVGKILSLILFASILITIVANSREFIEVMKVYDLPQSPPSYLLILLFLAVSVLAYLGLETIARFSKLMAFFLLLVYISVLVLSMKLYEPHRLFPILGYGLDTTVLSGIQRSSAYGEIIIIGVIIGSLHGLKHAKRAAYLSLIISASIITTALLAFTLAFPYYTGEEITAPIYLMATLIEYGEFIQRIEPLFFFLWNISTVISVAALFYVLIIIYAYIFELDDKRPIIIPLGIIVIFLALVPQNIVQLTIGMVNMIRSYGWAFYFIPPVLTLAIAKITKRYGGSTQ
ncbi:MAG: spore germination protein [Actinobacteria bacterium]|nr:spore germination protein [Actinomycetota bacterium]